MVSKAKKTTGSAGQDRRSVEDLGKTASQVIQEAAAVLEEELAAGLIAARKVSRRLAEEQRFEADDFAEALKRFRSTGQELIEIARGRIEELRSDTTQDLSQRFLTDAQGALDVLVDLIAVGPELANRFLRSSPATSGKDQPTTPNEGTAKPTRAKQ